MQSPCVTALALGRVVEHAAGLCAVSLFADRVNDIRHVNGHASIFHCEPECQQCLHSIVGKHIWDPFEDYVLVLGISNTDLCCLELVTFHLEAGEIFLDIAPFQAVHVEEGLMQVCLYVHALHSKECVDSAPLHLSC